MDIAHLPALGDFPIITGLKDNQWVQISTYMYDDNSAYIQTALKVPVENQANTDAMADEDEDRRVPAMRRCSTYGIRRKTDGSHERVLVGPERELLPRGYWTEHEV